MMTCLRSELVFKDRLDNQLQRRLDDTVLDSGDGHRELHKRSTSIWVGLRSVIRFIHSAINDSWS